MKIIAQNKKARHDYTIVKTFETGIVLKGSEIKSIRNGNVNLKDSFVKINQNHEVFVHNMHISKYKQAHTIEMLEERRMRKLLLHKQEIKKIENELKQQGYTLVPTKIYFSKNRVKLEIGLAKGKKLYDKRHDLKERDLKREMDKVKKNRI